VLLGRQDNELGRVDQRDPRQVAGFCERAGEVARLDRASERRVGEPAAPRTYVRIKRVGDSIGQNGVEFAHEQPDGKDPSLVADR
jgi:hypothetical protein